MLLVMIEKKLDPDKYHESNSFFETGTFGPENLLW